MDRASFCYIERMQIPVDTTNSKSLRLSGIGIHASQGFYRGLLPVMVPVTVTLMVSVDSGSSQYRIRFTL